jgi:hypothetical protein
MEENFSRMRRILVSGEEKFKEDARPGNPDTNILQRSQGFALLPNVSLTSTIQAAQSF